MLVAEIFVFDSFFIKNIIEPIYLWTIPELKTLNNSMTLINYIWMKNAFLKNMYFDKFTNIKNVFMKNTSIYSIYKKYVHNKNNFVEKTSPTSV